MYLVKKLISYKIEPEEVKLNNCFLFEFIMILVNISVFDLLKNGGQDRTTSIVQ